jgi:hypothetical protein
MIIDAFSELVPEDLKDLNKDYGDDLETLIGVINALGTNLASLGKQALNLSENVQADLRTVEVKKADSLPTIGNKFAPRPPKFVINSNCLQNVGVTWATDEKNQIKITSIVGTVTYPVTLNLLILW